MWTKIKDEELSANQGRRQWWNSQTGTTKSFEEFVVLLCQAARIRCRYTGLPFRAGTWALYPQSFHHKEQNELELRPNQCGRWGCLEKTCHYSQWGLGSPAHWLQGPLVTTLPSGFYHSRNRLPRFCQARHMDPEPSSCAHGQASFGSGDAGAWAGHSSVSASVSIKPDSLFIIKITNFHCC